MSQMAVLRPVHLQSHFTSADARAVARRLYRESRRAGLAKFDARGLLLRAVELSWLEGVVSYADGATTGFRRGKQTC